MKGLSSAVFTTVRAPVAAAILTLTALAPVAIAQDLARRLESIIQSADVGDARIGVRVLDLDSGRTLYTRDADTPYIPASNMKLLTSGAALAVLGPDYVFRTEVRIDGDRLIVIGAGDPALADPEVLRNTEPRMTVEDFLQTLVDAAETHLPGECSEIVIDDRIFDRELVHPTWDPDDLNKWYAPQVSGLNFHGNLLAVFATPSRAGAGSPPDVQIQPAASWIRVTNKARTTREGSNTHWPAREADANRFTLFGDVRSTAPLPLNTPTHDNAMLFGELYADRLMDRGIPVGGQTSAGLSPPRAVRLAQTGERLPEGRLIAVVTTPISEVLTRCNTDSMNLYAEALLKLLGSRVTGEPGTWASGASVLRMVIEEHVGSRGAASTIVADGSGLSHENLVSPNTLTEWLRHFAEEEELREPFMLSLAGPGRGTFTRRFRGMDFENRVMGKSGVLTGVRTLSGYVVADSGRTLVFSVMANNALGSSGPKATRLADQIVAELDSYLASVEEAAAPAFGG